MKKINIKWIISVFVVALVLALGTFIYQNFWPRHIRMAVALDNAPFSFRDPVSQQMIGLDVDVIQAIGNKENITIDLIGVKDTNLLSAVSTCQFEAGMGMLPVEQNSNLKVDFSDAYVQIGQVLTTRADETMITGRESLSGHQVGVQVGSIGALELEKDPSTSLVFYPTVNQLFQSLVKGNIEAAVSENTIAMMFVAESHGTLKTTGKLFNAQDRGIAFCQSPLNLRNRINRGLEKIKSEGRLDELIQNWFTGNNNMNNPNH
jgi:ABC-type amino acid transport substrate-binding protein